jgi:hypothetical protein
MSKRQASGGGALSGARSTSNVIRHGVNATDSEPPAKRVRLGRDSPADGTLDTELADLGVNGSSEWVVIIADANGKVLFPDLPH